jgi:uncharacterized membrane protein YkoI
MMEAPMKSSLILISTFFSSLAMAEKMPDNFAECRQAALHTQAGDVIKVELKKEEGALIYEFDIRGTDGQDWDIECSVTDVKITEVEREVDNIHHPLFEKNLVVDEKAARDIALKAYPGAIVEVEYEIEENGNSSYEFDIDTDSGKEMKIEIDAKTGKIVEADEEIWQVGLE